MAPSHLASTVSEAVHLDQNRVALLSDTHISVDPDSVYPGTKWPGSPVKDSEHEWVNMANCLSQTAKSVIALNPRPANLIVNGDGAHSNGKEAEYKEFIRPVSYTHLRAHETKANLG